MKKHIFIISALLIGLGSSAAAQTQEKRDLLDKIEDLEIGPEGIIKHKEREFKVVEISLLDNLGYGLTNVKTDAFTSKFGRSWEFFLNIVDISLNPTRWLSFDVGGDIKIDSFKPGKEEYFTLDDDSYPIVGTYSESEMKQIKSSSSRLQVYSLSVPVTLGLNFGGVNIRGGAEFFWPLAAKCSFVENKIQTENGWDKTRLWRAKTEKIGLNYMAAISFEGLGLYFKYHPKPLVPYSASSSFNYWTAGIVLGF